MSGMFRQRPRMDDDVIDLHIRVLFVRCQYLVQGPLKCRRGIAQPKRHYSELEQSVFRLALGPRDMLWVDSDLVITLLEV